MKDYQKGIVQAAIVAVGIIVLGFCIQSGLGRKVCIPSRRYP